MCEEMKVTFLGKIPLDPRIGNQILKKEFYSRFIIY
jgi:hypothetical protein